MNFTKKIVISTLFLTISAIASGCFSKEVTISQPQSVSASTSMNYSISDLEKSVHEEINKYRVSRGLPKLQMDYVISRQAKKHSSAMANGKTQFSHDGFDQRVENIGDEISYRSAAENIAFNYGHENPVPVAVKGWIKSPGHHKNIVGKFNKTGIGVAKNKDGEYYFTQIFILSPKN